MSKMTGQLNCLTLGLLRVAITPPKAFFWGHPSGESQHRWMALGFPLTLRQLCLEATCHVSSVQLVLSWTPNCGSKRSLCVSQLGLPYNTALQAGYWLSHSCGGQRSKIKVLAGLFPSVASLLGLQMAAFSCLQGHWLPTLVASFNLITPLKTSSLNMVTFWGPEG